VLNLLSARAAVTHHIPEVVYYMYAELETVAHTFRPPSPDFNGE